MKLILSLFLIALSLNNLSARPKHYELENYSFEQYVIDFQKNYSPSEYEQRRVLFNLKLVEIMKHNQNPNNKWKKGVNSHSDLTHEEFKVKRLMRKNNEEKQQQQFMKIKKNNSNKVEQKTEAQRKSLPDSINWKDDMNPVRDQMWCGSCWAFSTTAVVEGHFNIYNKNEYNKLVLSTQQLVSCLENPNHCGGTGGCSGATIELAMEYIKANGQTSEVAFPYFAGDGYCFWDSVKEPAQVSIEDYVRLKSNDQEEVLEALANKGPLAIVVDASHWQDYEEGIFDGCDYNKNIDINHGVALVGYGSDNGTDYWLVRNSWGPYFGEEGHIRLLREKEAKCGVDSTPQDGSACKGDNTPYTVCGMCGILSESTYPTGVKPIIQNLII